MEFRETQSESKGFFLRTLDFIGACILFSLFLFVSYGSLVDDSVFSWFGNLISSLFKRFLIWFLEEIFLPLAGVVGVIKFVIYVFSGETETIYEYELETKKPENSKQNPPALSQETPSRSRREYDFSIRDLNESGGGDKKYTQGSSQAIAAWQDSEERQALENRKRQLERQIEIEVAKIKKSQPDFFED